MAEIGARLDNSTLSLAKMIIAVCWGTHFKCGMDWIERIMSYSEGFFVRLLSRNLNRTLESKYVLQHSKELEVKGHAGDSLEEFRMW